MFIKFKGNEKEFTTTSIVEQKLYKQYVASGWLLSLHISGDFTAESIDSELTTESISEITLVGENEQKATITGYEKVTSCVVRYSDGKTTAEIQLVKGV